MSSKRDCPVKGNGEAVRVWHLRIQPAIQRAGKFHYPRPRHPPDATRFHRGIHDSPPQHPTQMPTPLRPVKAREGDGLASFGLWNGHASLSELRSTAGSWGIVNAAGVGRGRNGIQPATVEQFIKQVDTGNSGKVPVSSAPSPQGRIPPHLAAGLYASRGELCRALLCIGSANVGHEEQKQLSRRAYRIVSRGCFAFR